MFFRPRCIGFARRRVGRGGRIIIDRVSTDYDDIWSKLDYTIYDNGKALEESRIKDTCIINSNKQAINSINLSEISTNRSLKSQNEHFNNNIVIKSENSKTPNELLFGDDDQINRVSQRLDKSSTDGINQKLDDFEQLLDNANASSNIINKNLVYKKSNDISNDSSFHIKTIANNLSSSEIFNKNVNVLNSFNSDTISTGISSTNGNGSATATTTTSSGNSTVTSQKMEVDLTTSDSPLIINDDDKQHNALIDNEHDVYKDLFDEIRDEWLHFQPLSPSMEMDDFVFDSDIINDTKKFSVELQLIDDSKNETENTNCIDNTYLTQPMSFNCRNNSLDILPLGEHIPSDSVNIKTEPVERDFDSNNEQQQQSTDSKHTKVDSMRVDDDTDDKFMSMLNSIDSMLLNNHQVGCSNFKIVDEISPFSKQLLEKESEELSSTDGGVTIKNENESTEPEQVISSNSSNTSTAPIVIREAPIAELQSHNYVLQYGSPASSASELTKNTTKYVNSGINVTIGNSTNVLQQQFVNTGNTILSTASPQQKMQSIVYDNNTFVLATTRKQLNGPGDRTCKYFIIYSLLLHYHLPPDDETNFIFNIPH